MMPEPQMSDELNVRAPYYHVARTERGCPCCDKPTPVFAISLPAEHEILIVDDDTDVSHPRAESWQCAGVRAWIFHILRLPPDVQRRLRAIAPRFHRAADAAAKASACGSTWINHCAHCGASQADDDLHCEPDVAFMPMSAGAAARVSLARVYEPIDALACGYAQDPPLFDSMSGL